jgi:hypothetical protein
MGENREAAELARCSAMAEGFPAAVAVDLRMPLNNDKP